MLAYWAVRKVPSKPQSQNVFARLGICYSDALTMQPVTYKGRIIDKPWGHELIWAHTERYVGKILHINKGESLSYQYHRVKDETVYLLAGVLEMDLETDNGRTTVRFFPGDCLHITPGMNWTM